MSNTNYFYSQALHTLIALQKRYLSSIGKLTPAEEDSIWQVIIGQRVEVFIIIFLIKVPIISQFCYLNFNSLCSAKIIRKLYFGVKYLECDVLYLCTVM